MDRKKTLMLIGLAGLVLPEGGAARPVEALATAQVHRVRGGVRADRPKHDRWLLAAKKAGLPAELEDRAVVAQDPKLQKAIKDPGKPTPERKAPPSLEGRKAPPAAKR